LTAASLAMALERAANLRFDGERLRCHAEQFSRERHISAMKAIIDDTMAAPAGARW